MIRKVVLNQLLTNYSLFKSKYFLLSSIKNVTRKSQFYYSSQCSHKFCYKFSNLSKKELEKKAIDEANIIYNKYKWTDQFVKRMLQKIDEVQDNEITFILIEFYLLKIQENVGIYSKQYTKILFFGIDFVFRNGMKHKSGQWLETLEQILKKNPHLGKSQIDNYYSPSHFNTRSQTVYTHIQFNIAQLLQVYKINEAEKWLELFIHKYKDFDETAEVTDKQRFYAYLQLTDIYFETKKIEQASKMSKKLFALIQKQKTKNVSKEGVTSGIFKYGIILISLGSREEAIKAFNKVEHILDWNTPTNIKLVVKIIQSYLKIGGFNQRASALLQKLQKYYQKQKDNMLFRIMYDDTTTNRTTIYIMLDKYQRLYQTLKISKDNQRQNKQFVITYQIMSALCLYKLGKKHEGQISLKKALVATQSIKNPSPDFQPATNYFYAQIAEKKLKDQLSQQSQQIISKIKQKLLLLKILKQSKNKN